MTRFEAGQPVAAVTVYDSHADYLCVPAGWLVPVPRGLDPAQAAIVVSNLVTAYQMLHRAARESKGQRLLVHGAVGGVGSAVVQLCRLAGVQAFGTGSPAQAATISGLGATPIDYTKDNFAASVN